MDEGEVGRDVGERDSEGSITSESASSLTTKTASSLSFDEREVSHSSTLPTTPAKSPRLHGSNVRLSKPSSWFNSLTRRGTIRGHKKRSEDHGENGGPSNHAGASVRSPNRQRLHKSDWDVRSSPSVASQSRCELEEDSLMVPGGLDRASRSTDVLNSFDSSETSQTSNRFSDVGVLSDSSGSYASFSFDGGQQVYNTLDNRTSRLSKKTMMERRRWIGVKQFNLDSEVGIQYLLNEAVIESNCPQAIGRFLFQQERLSKKQIGKYLGSHLEFNREVLKHFVQCHQFSNLLLVNALRTFLWSFRLPGEAMQIDRIMDAFATHYCDQNPDIFQETDTCFILSFSIIMLNTALHNPNVKMKITSEQFIKQNRGINSGRDLPSDMLEAIFKNIKEEPFKIPDETYDDRMYTFFSPGKEGWLWKQGGSWKTWKRRYFLLKDRCLYYFQYTSENVPKGIIPLENIQVRKVDDRDGKSWVLEIYSDSTDIVKGCKTDSSGTVVPGNHKYYRMSASSEEDRDGWIEAIRDAIRDNPYQRIIAEKKAAIRRRSSGNNTSGGGHRPTSSPRKRANTPPRIACRKSPIKDQAKTKLQDRGRTFSNEDDPSLGGGDSQQEQNGGTDLVLEETSEAAQNGCNAISTHDNLV